MTPIGEGVGVQISKMKKLLTVLLTGFIMGVIITISEPDLQVLASQVPSVPNMVLILTVAVGAYLGKELAGLSFHWILIPIGALIGYYIVKAEPTIGIRLWILRRASRWKMKKRYPFSYWW